MKQNNNIINWRIISIIIIILLSVLIVLAIKPFISYDILYTSNDDIEMLETAVRSFYMDKHRYPTLSEGLNALVPYIDADEIPLDPWGNQYYYLYPGPNNIEFGIISFGEDGIPGGKKDFYSWK